MVFEQYLNPQYLALLHDDHARVLVSFLLCLLLTVDTFKLGLETAAPQSHAAFFAIAVNIQWH